MKTMTKLLALCSLLCLPLCAAVQAAGPIDGEVSAVWWANDFEIDNGTANASSDAGAPGLRASLWLHNRYGVHASRFGSDADNANGADYTSFDVMWRALSPTENNFVALGLGWQQMDVEGIGDAASGARVTVEGRMSLMSVLQAYGHGSYLPSLSDITPDDPALGPWEDVNAYEYELGVAWNAMPFMDVHAGYRVTNLSFTETPLAPLGNPGTLDRVSSTTSGGVTTPSMGGGDGCIGCQSAAISTFGGETQSSGFFLGVGVHF